MKNQVDCVAFKLFELPIYWYAIIITIAIIMALWLSIREALRVGLKEDDMVFFLFWALPIGIIGARFYYILFNINLFLTDPIQVFNIRNGGLAIYGGLIASVIVLIVYTRHYSIDTWLFLDVIAPNVMLAQSIGRWGNFMNHEAYGAETSHLFLKSLYLPNFIINNMYINDKYRHPTFFYESIWTLLGVILIVFCRKKYPFKRGEIFLIYLIWYSFGRFFIEKFRMDSLYLIGEIRVSQLLSALFFFLGTFLFYYRHKHLHIELYERDKGLNKAII
ncbi:prolipoprotein diacylglyceryl transferase [Enterococcus avium]|uniref:prolipoprotein diacylglyceryl transferase n=1 Tax=Enterococcus avium TaxID=33945 RepID=UPI001F5ABDE0|nr:prolipoprotein diacylglyceryl transferase [Enterococcus avium]